MTGGPVYEIHIVAWDKFQHGGTRDNPWIKDYRDQLHKTEWRDLSFHLRGVLQSLRLAYAASHRQLRGSTLALTRQLGMRVSTRDLESLNHAGFITLSASSVLAQNREEKRRIEEPPPPPLPVLPVPVAANGDAAQVQAVYDYWREKRGRARANYARISDGRRAKIRARLREFTVDELKTCIDGVAKDPWEDRARHDDITIIFRSREQTEKFLDLASASRNGHHHGTPLEQARAWILSAGWRYPDADLVEELGKRGIEGPDKRALADLALKLQAESA